MDNGETRTFERRESFKPRIWVPVPDSIELLRLMGGAPMRPYLETK